MRQSWDEYFSLLASLVAERATCPRRQVGCVLVDKKHRIISTGYNGAPSGHSHCTDIGCDMVGGTCRRTIHAEVNSLRPGLQDAILGGSIYTTDFPCPNCTALLCSSGLAELIYYRPYHTGMEESTTLLESFGVKVRQYIPWIMREDAVLTDGVNEVYINRGTDGLRT